MATVTAGRRAASRPALAVWPGLAISALLSALVLVAMGSIVRVTGHGLGCPDWPLCYGRVIPPALTGAWVEFSHRLLGAVASLQIGLLAVFALRQRHSPWIFWPAVGGALLLGGQVLLGGLHVLLETAPLTGLIHTGTAMLVVGLLAVQVAATTPTARPLGGQKGLAVWLTVTAAAAFGLLLSGSLVTRSGASLACPSWPACGAGGLGTHPLIDIQLLHRGSAYTVALLVGVAVAWLLWRERDPGVRRLAAVLAVLVLVQGSLGVANVWLRLPMATRVLHLTVGTSLWAVLVLAWTWTVRAGPRR